MEEIGFVAFLSKRQVSGILRSHGWEYVLHFAEINH